MPKRWENFSFVKEIKFLCDWAVGMGMRGKFSCSNGAKRTLNKSLSFAVLLTEVMRAEGLSGFSKKFLRSLISSIVNFYSDRISSPSMSSLS